MSPSGETVVTAVVEQCLTCSSLSGTRRISPGPTVHNGRYWVVEHANPCSLRGWLVVVLKRHAEALHELTAAEFEELARLQAACAQALHAVTGCVKEYAMCFGEAPGHHHVHFHVVPRAADLANDLRGAGVFAKIKVSEADALSPASVTKACIELRSALERYV